MLPGQAHPRGDCTEDATFEPRGRQNGVVEPLEVEVVVSDEEQAERAKALTDLIEVMRPAVQADGGDLVLVDADLVAGVVEVQLQGACSSCAISSATLQGGVERILRGRLPWVTEVIGTLDEEADPAVSVALGRGGYVPRL